MGRVAVATGLAALTATTGLLFSMTSASGATCPAPTQEGPSRPVGPVSVPTCTVDLKEVKDLLTPNCDPGPCDPTAAPPQE